MHHMSPDEFRRHGRAVVDWIADYWEGLQHLPVTPGREPGATAALLPDTAPETGEPFDDLLADMDRVVVPGTVHWQHPGFLGYFPMTTSGPAVLAELLAAGLNTQGMLWSTSPAAAEIEARVSDWLAELMDLPESFRGNGVIQDTASTGVLLALIAARTRAERDGAGPYVVYTSEDGNACITKAARVLGIPDAHLRRVPVAAWTRAMDPADLAARIGADRAAGLTPLAVVATVGTTATTAVDPLDAIGVICREQGVWLHVDAAYAGVAAICPEMRWIHRGLDQADSYSTNPHKWLLTGLECSLTYFADPAPLHQAMRVTAAYLHDRGEARIDYQDWQIPLGKRFRALKLWFVLRAYGREGLQRHLREGIACAEELASWIEADERFELAAPHPFGLVCFRHRAGDGAGRELLARVNADRRLFLTSTESDGRFLLRIAAGGTATTSESLKAAWQRISQTADQVTTAADPV
ncbi:aromatic-L-amino-acid decarboxylase [Glycomyces algeriensis]|uniref:Aromatic-L-amino-acid decarboxylase n=2 Tax=Glycomyces algeriensis TaxID=256037 RepID=A0A9W6GBL7_9ACTN|nr:aromatic-L-amino-acid decarboxylase [Glycomyces algeriensis]